MSGPESRKAKREAKREARGGKNAGPSNSQPTGPSSPQATGPSSPQATGPSSPQATGLSSPQAAGLSSPQATGLSSPQATGLSSPPATGLSSPQATGLSSPPATGSSNAISGAGQTGPTPSSGPPTFSAAGRSSSQSATALPSQTPSPSHVSTRPGSSALSAQIPQPGSQQLAIRSGPSNNALAASPNGKPPSGNALGKRPEVAPEHAASSDTMRKEPKYARNAKLSDQTWPRLVKSTARPSLIYRIPSLQIEANYFEIMKKPSILYKYRVDFGPFKNRPVTSRGLRRIVIGSLLGNVAGSDHATDYFDTIITTKPLDFLNGAHVGSLSCPILTPLLTSPESVVVTVSLVTQHDVSALDEWTSEDEFKDCADLITSLNVISQRNLSNSNNAASGIVPPLLTSRTLSPSTYWIKAGQNKYFRSGEQFPSLKDGGNLGEGMHWRRGFYASVRPGKGKVLLNINVATSAFFNIGTLKDLWNSQPPQARNSFQDLVKGLQVRLMYVPPTMGNNQTISPEMIAPAADLRLRGSLKKVSETKTMKVILPDFKTKFGSLLGGYNLPEYLLINIGAIQAPNWIPAELLWIEPDQSVKGLLTPKQTSHMIQGARRLPSENRTFVTGQATTAINATSLATDFGLHVAPTLLKIGAHILQPPKVFYQASKSLKNTEPSRIQSGQWNLESANSSLALKRKPRVFAVIHLGDPRMKDALTIDFLPNLNVLKGVSKDDFRYAKLNSFGLDDLKQWWNSDIIVRNRPDAVLVILKDKNADTYAGIKYFTDMHVGVPNVCVLAEKLLGNGRILGKAKDLGFRGNIDLKLNVQLGGINQVVDVPFGSGSQTDFRKKTMVVGADVTHPGAGSVPHCPSIAAIVGSVDTEWSKYPGSIRLQSSKQEMIGDLKSMMSERLSAWSEANGGRMPENILFYRDGVSESQFALVKQHELPQIHAACKKMADEKKSSRIIKVTHLIVDKRHNTRFYPPKDATGIMVDKQGNFLPGLVVDDHVTIPMCSDFYLQSHKALAGTARNSHYFVLENGIGLNMQELQSMTFSLCFLYARSTTAVSYATPAYYADRLCDRARFWLRGMLVRSSIHNEAVRGCYNIPAHHRDPADKETWVVDWANNFWRCPVRLPGDNTPWHPSLDDRMFYL